MIVCGGALRVSRVSRICQHAFNSDIHSMAIGKLIMELALKEREPCESFEEVVSRVVVEWKQK